MSLNMLLTQVTNRMRLYVGRRRLILSWTAKNIVDIPTFKSPLMGAEFTPTVIPTADLDATPLDMTNVRGDLLFTFVLNRFIILPFLFQCGRKFLDNWIEKLKLSITTMP